jgi:DUF1680 family protein
MIGTLLLATVIAGLPQGEPNRHYQGNRAPLAQAALVNLPVGAVKPEGWIRGQLVRLADGFSGRLGEISRFCKFEGNAWTTPDGSGRFGWEEVPYWLKGYVNLGLILQDKRIIDDSRRWIEAVMKTQQPSGYFGSRSNLEEQMYLATFRSLDLWPNMVMLYPLRTWYEATGDKRIPEFMLRYFRWVDTLPLDQFLPASWQKWRAGDQLDSIYWLYNLTGEARLLDTARVTHERTADWVGSIPTWHGVNLSQCFREPAQYYQQTKDARYLRATERVYDTVMGIYGQAPGGMFGADENARPGFRDPRQGAETCSMVEMMFSHEMLAAITGEAKWLDRAEEVAYNSLPASMTPDLKGLHYLTAPNMIQLDRTGKQPYFDNGGDMLSYNPFQYRCCQHNVVMGWPYYAERIWMATAGNGLAAAFYAPSEVKAKVGSAGIEARIAMTTGYPFTETVSIKVAAVASPARFPLALRIPAWCKTPQLKVNGALEKPPAPEKGWLTLEREWKAGDAVELTLPMELSVKRWPKMKNAASVHLGPLAFSLKIGERWERYGGSVDWPAYEVFPTSPWNYALELDGKLEVIRGPAREVNFTHEGVPLAVRARGRRLTAWRQEPNGLPGPLQASPARTDAADEEVVLVPMGAARLRISSFPVAAKKDEAGHVWDDNPALVRASAASHFEPPTAANDGELQTSSLDPGGAERFTWAGRAGSEEWIEYSFARPRRANWADVHWVDDAAQNGPARLPQSWRLVCWDGAAWQPVKTRADYGLTEDRVGRVEFETVESTAFRLEVRLARGRTAGLTEWRLGHAGAR